MEAIVLASAHGYSTAFKISTAKVYSLDFYMYNWEVGRFPYCAWIHILNNDEAKARRLTSALIKKEFPQYMNSPWYLRYNR